MLEFFKQVLKFLGYSKKEKQHRSFGSIPQPRLATTTRNFGERVESGVVDIHNVQLAAIASKDVTSEDALLLKILSESDPEKLWEFYNDAPPNSRAEESALKRVAEVLTPLLASASNFSESLYVFKYVEDGSEIAHESCKKVLTFACTLEECEEVRAHDRDDTFEDEIVNRENEIKRQIIADAATLDECFDIHNSTDDSGISLLAIEKALTLANTYDDCIRVAEEANRDEDEIEEKARAKAASFCDSIEDCLQIISDYDCDPDLMQVRAAIMRAAGIIVAENLSY